MAISSSCHVTCSLTAIPLPAISSRQHGEASVRSVHVYESVLYSVHVYGKCSIFKTSNAQFVIMKTFLFVSRTDDILNFVPLSLLTALNLSLYSGEAVMDSVSKAFCS